VHAPVPCSASTEETTSINPNPIRLHDLYVLVTPAISHHHHVALEPARYRRCERRYPGSHGL
jgi:hypothetical protein